MCVYLYRGMYICVCTRSLTELASLFLNLDKKYWIVILYIPEVCQCVRNESCGLEWKLALHATGKKTCLHLLAVISPIQAGFCTWKLLRNYSELLITSFQLC